MDQLNHFSVVTIFMCLFALGVMAMRVELPKKVFVTISDPGHCDGDFVCELQYANNKR